RNGEVKEQVGDAEQARDAGKTLDGPLHVRLDEEMQRPFQRDEPVSVSVGFRQVRADEATCNLVEPVWGETRGCLGAERMPNGQPGSQPAKVARARRADRRGA